jgi:hypothetical protein
MGSVFTIFKFERDTQRRARFQPDSAEPRASSSTNLRCVYDYCLGIIARVLFIGQRDSCETTYLFYYYRTYVLQLS